MPNFDEHIKKQVKNFRPEVNGTVWSRIEEELNAGKGHKKRRFAFWLWILIPLLFTGAYFFLTSTFITQKQIITNSEIITKPTNISAPNNTAATQNIAEANTHLLTKELLDKNVIDNNSSAIKKTSISANVSTHLPVSSTNKKATQRTITPKVPVTPSPNHFISETPSVIAPFISEHREGEYSDKTVNRIYTLKNKKANAFMQEKTAFSFNNSVPAHYQIPFTAREITASPKKTFLTDGWEATISVQYNQILEKRDQKEISAFENHYNSPTLGQGTGSYMIPYSRTIGYPGLITKPQTLPGISVGIQKRFQLNNSISFIAGINYQLQRSQFNVGSRRDEQVELEYLNTGSGLGAGTTGSNMITRYYDPGHSNKIVGKQERLFLNAGVGIHFGKSRKWKWESNALSGINLKQDFLVPNYKVGIWVPAKDIGTKYFFALETGIHYNFAPRWNAGIVGGITLTPVSEKMPSPSLYWRNAGIKLSYLFKHP